MRAREYLRGIKRLDVLIEQKLEEKEELRRGLEGLSAVSAGCERVKGGELPGDGRVVRMLDKIDLLEREIDGLIDVLVDKKRLILQQIQRVGNPGYMFVLYGVYVRGKRMREIAKEMHYSYGYVRQLHWRALQEFEKINKINKL